MLAAPAHSQRGKATVQTRLDRRSDSLDGSGENASQNRRMRKGASKRRISYGPQTGPVPQLQDVWIASIRLR